MSKIGFKDLTWPLKALVIWGFIGMITWVVYFIWGFIEGLKAVV